MVATAKTSGPDGHGTTTRPQEATGRTGPPRSKPPGSCQSLPPPPLPLAWPVGIGLVWPAKDHPLRSRFRQTPALHGTPIGQPYSRTNPLPQCSKDAYARARFHPCPGRGQQSPGRRWPRKRNLFDFRPLFRLSRPPPGPLEVIMPLGKGETSPPGDRQQICRDQGQSSSPTMHALMPTT